MTSWLMVPASGLAVILALLLTATNSRATAGPVGPIKVDRVVQGTVSGSPPRERQLRTTDFIDVSHGFLATQNASCTSTNGCSSALLATVDGGKTWQVVHLGTDFTDLSFLSPAVGFGVTATGRLLTTHDGGRHWATSHAPVGTTARVDFISAHAGWVLAGDLFRTIDGGASWTRLPFHCGRNQMIARVSFVDRTIGYLLCQVQNGPFALSLYRSTDGGSSWRRVSIVDSMAHVVGTLDFVSARTGFVGAGFGNLLRTANGGRIFRPVRGTPPDEVQDASWLSPRTGYALGRDILMRTADAGIHWEQVYPAVEPVGPIALMGSGAGIGIGSQWAPDWFTSAILRTTDGTHWRQVANIPGATEIDQLVRTPPRTVWVSAHLAYMTGPAAAVFRSTDNGKSWRRLLAVGPGGTGSLSLVGSQLSFLAIADTRHLFVTTDGGRRWSRRTENVSTWNDQFVSASSGWAFGANYSLLHTSDGGRRWRTVATLKALGVCASGLYFINARDGWITGTHCGSQAPGTPVMLRTRDGGAHWLLVRFHQLFASHGFDWVTPRVGYVMQNGALYRTGDGGITWHTRAT
jgi:photosystem II stability/assembly factor-like uncharacterized protein